MKNMKFNKYERVAGLFILVAILGSAAAGVSIAVKQGWFEQKYYYNTIFENAEGIHVGSTVKMSGLNVGSIEEIDLLSDNKVRVVFYVLGKYRERVRADSKAQLLRPFIIGDRVLDVSVGSDQSVLLAENANIQSEESIDMMNVLSGRKMGNYLGKISEMMSNLQHLAEAFLDKNRTESMVRIFDRLDPLMRNLNNMSLEVTKLSQQATHDNNMQVVLQQAAQMTTEINKILPELNEKNPELAGDLAKLTHSLAQVTEEFDRVVKTVGPDMPKTALRAVEALDEATVLIKAMQKSMLLRSNVEVVREEEAKKADKERLPASK